MYDDETQLTQVQAASDKELAERVRFQKHFSNSKLGKKQVAFICQLIKETSKEIYEEKSVRDKERIGELEKALTDLEHKVDMKDQLHDSDIKGIKTSQEEYKDDNIRLVSAVGVILLIIIGAVGLFK